MFKKINLNFTNIDLDKIKGTNAYSNPPVFFEYQIKNQIYLYQFFKNKIIFNIKPDHINLTEIHSPGVKPHTDKWSVALNCYLNSGEESTIVWKEKINNFDFQKTDEGIKRYYQKNLEIINSFNARKADCFLLDTHQIHSVNVQDEKRIILRFLWAEHTFNNILNSIEIIN